MARLYVRSKAKAAPKEFKPGKSFSRHRFDSSLKPFYKERDAIRKAERKAACDWARTIEQRELDAIAEQEAKEANAKAEAERMMDMDRYSAGLSQLAHTNRMKQLDCEMKMARQF